ncbi:MAG TPA: hypothetical protein VGS28_04280 [Candidatus Saccharimonadales bacterium]|nr:hypothetical protein [Candidatus Saccharimonadales bacterium]
MKGETDDCDVRVRCEDLKQIDEYVQAHYGCRTNMCQVRKFERGYYVNNCLQVWFGDTRFDICGKMITLCDDIGEVEFPFSDEVFQEATTREYFGVHLPVCSLENLLLYYLVHRRAQDGSKDDAEKIRSILKSDSLSFEKLTALIQTLQCREHLENLLGQYTSTQANVDLKTVPYLKQVHSQYANA